MMVKSGQTLFYLILHVFNDYESRSATIVAGFLPTGWIGPSSMLWDSLWASMTLMLGRTLRTRSINPRRRNIKGQKPICQT